MRTGLAIALGFAAVLVAPAALAQDTEQTGTAATTVEPPQVTTTVRTTTTAPAAAVETKEDTVTDHEKVVGHLGVGYLGLTEVPIASGVSGGGVGRGSLDAPVIGIRYWLSEKMGIDAGLGFTMFSSSRTVEAANRSTETKLPAAFGVALHGGLPIAFAYAKHYKFLVIPELNIAFAHRGIAQDDPDGPGPAGAPPDIVNSGFRLDVGARAGAEIQFGFIGIPELALQATVGLAFRHQRWGVSQDGINGGPPSSASENQTSIGTTVQSDPWALFVNNISALYYFP